MLLTDKIEQWIEEQLKQGKTEAELHDTYFIGENEHVAVLRKCGRRGFELNNYLSPRAVDFRNTNELTALQNENARLKEALNEIHECVNSFFYTEDGGIRLNPNLSPYKGSINIIHKLSNIKKPI